MKSQNINLDNSNFTVDNTVEPQHLISLTKFSLLSVASFGLYELWWVYKAWRFYQQKEDLDILPGWRAIFNLFFLYSLLDKIKGFAHEKGAPTNYSVSLLFIGFLVTTFSARLPEPYWILSTLSVVFLIAPFQALNYAKRNSPELVVQEQGSFNTKQIIVLIIDSIMWSLIILGLMMEV